MAHYRVFPHPIATSSSVIVGDWWYQMDGGDIQLLPESIDGWDYSSTTVIGVDVEIDSKDLSDSVRMPLEAVNLIVAIDCPTVGERFVQSAPVTAGSQSLAVEIPPGRGADAFVASVHLVANPSLESKDSSRVSLLGSRLFDSEPRRVKVEGSTGRFPVEVCSFSSIGFESAPWTLVADFDDLNDSFMGSVRLFINSEHPLGALATNPSTGASSARMMQIDTMRLLVSEVARSGMFSADATWDDEGVAFVIDSMCNAYFGRNLGAMVHLLNNDPAAFERVLYDSVSFEGVKSL